MDPTSSVSKGVFVFKGNSDPKSANSRNNPWDNSHVSQLWYQSYRDLWQHIEKKMKRLHSEMFSNIQTSLIKFIKECYKENVTEIPTAALLMGVNMTDHKVQFLTLSSAIKERIRSHVAVLNAQACSDIKQLVESMVSQFVNDASDTDDCDDEVESKIIRKSLCTFSLLQAWYNDKYREHSSSTSGICVKRQKLKPRKTLVVIVPEFESIDETVLQNFILIASAYLNDLPFIIIFGVATSLDIVHKALPYHVSAKLNMQVFHSQSSTEYLNNLLNNIILTDTCYFHLGGKLFSFLTDIFLFYDLSVKGFMQKFKFVMLEHYYRGNQFALCTSVKKLDYILNSFEHEDFENVRMLISFRKYVEDTAFETRIKLIEDDNYFKNVLKENILKLHEYISCFHVFLKCLFILVSDLPNAPLGSQFRELYIFAVTKRIVHTEEYNRCIQLLKFLSKDDLLSKLNKICDALKQYPATGAVLNFLHILTNISKDIQRLNIIATQTDDNEAVFTEQMNRLKLKEELLKMSRKSKHQNNYEIIREEVLMQITKYFEKYLVAPKEKPFHEIFFYNDVSHVESHLMGSQRAAVHTALMNPQVYLKCRCCSLPTESSILPTLPDLSIVYKLHLEHGKYINMHDWLHAFAVITQPSDIDDEEHNDIDSKIQARFTRAVADLEFLGFIKPSKRKVDHVERLTWGAY